MSWRQQSLNSAGNGFSTKRPARRPFGSSSRRPKSNGRPAAARIRYRYRFTLRVAAAPAPPRPAVLRGVVRDAQNRALSGATLELQSAHETSRQTTDSSGGFRFLAAEPGKLVVVVTAPGFLPFRAEEDLHANDDLQVTYRLRVRSAAGQPAASEDTQGVTVVGDRASREVTRTTLAREEVMHIPGTGGDALRSVQNLPGVARPSFLSGDLIVRGSAPGDTQVFADGTGLPLLYHFGGLSSVIPTEMLDRIDFYPGNFSSQYGRAMGGVVDVGLRSPRTQGYHAVVNISAASM